MPTQIKPSTGLMTALLLFFTLTLAAQEQPTLPVGPTTTITFEEPTYDFGTVEEGTRVSHVFTFTNTGDEPLILSNARGSCGCTVPQWPREPLQPGETASLTVEFNSKNKKGKRSQKVTITANTNPPQTFLYLNGEIAPRQDNAPALPEVKLEVETNPDCFAIFPNPTAEILKLNIEESNLGKRALISIFAKTGQVMAKREIEAVEGPIEFNVSHYPAGTYIANVQIEGRPAEARCFVVVE